MPRDRDAEEPTFELARAPFRLTGHDHPHLHSHGGAHDHSASDPSRLEHAGGSHGHSHADHAPYGFVVGVAAERPILSRGAGQGKTLFLDCATGIAGDMTMAALLDLGLPSSVVTEAWAQLPGFDVRLSVVTGHVGSIGACQVSVEYEGGRDHRPYGEIRELLRRSELDDKTRGFAEHVFQTLAEAEAEVHRVPLLEVEFHEVGSADAIADIVGVSALVSYLGASVISSPLPLGRGWVHTAHGALPLPAPATLLCLRGVPTYPSGLEVELVTPTGAALLTHLAQGYCNWPEICPERVGIGAGHRALPDRPNVLRAILGTRPSPGLRSSELVVLEANLDDMTPEVLAHAQAKLLEAGALDVWLSPTIMKKSRPAVVLSALAPPEAEERLTQLVFAETTTLGIRTSRVARVELPRRMEVVGTRYGDVRYKVSGQPASRVKVEIEDVIAIATQRGLALPALLDELGELGRRLFVEPRG